MKLNLFGTWFSAASHLSIAPRAAFGALILSVAFAGPIAFVGPLAQAATPKATPVPKGGAANAAASKVAGKPSASTSATATPAPSPFPKITGPSLPPHFGAFGVDDKASPNTIPLKTADGKETLNVEMMPVLSDDSYKTATANKTGVSVEFSSNGARVLHNYFVTHVGKKLAFAVGGHLVSVMVMKEPLEGIVTLTMSPKDAAEVVTSVNTKVKMPAPSPSPVMTKPAAAKK